jgi:hypothetical protein
MFRPSCAVEWLFCLVLLLLPLYAPAQQPSVLLPVDEAALRPAFFAFRARLQQAIARRDARTILDAVDPDVRTSFGDGGGLDDFHRQWRPDTPDSPLWSTLGTVLALGGSFADDGSFRAPYVFSRWPDDMDAFEHMAVVAESVRVRERPGLDAPVVGSVSFGIVRVEAPEDREAPWRAVRLADGRRGFMATQYLRSPVDYRAIFSETAGGWRLTAFVAGD